MVFEVILIWLCGEFVLGIGTGSLKFILHRAGLDDLQNPNIQISHQNLQRRVVAGVAQLGQRRKTEALIP